MAHRVLFLNNIYLPALLISFLAASCSPSDPTPETQKAVDLNNANIEIREDIYYFNKQPFTGCLFALQNNGKDSLFCGNFTDGKPDGLYKKWYPNGRVAEIRIFDRGLKTGTHQGFWENGMPWFRFHFEKDLYEGTQYKWRENGSVYTRRNYKHGQEEGMQQEWDSNGKLTINYQALNGRQYGNIGKKNCTSMWADSIYSKPRP